MIEAPYRLMTTAMIAAACLIQSTAGVSADDSESYHREYSRPPVVLTVAIAKTRLKVAEPTTLELQLEAPIGTEVTFPSIDHAIGKLQVIRSTEQDSIPTGGAKKQRRWTREYVLESIRAGTMVIAPIAIDYRLPGKANDSQIATEPVDLMIETTLTEDAGTKSFRDIKEAVEIADPPSTSRNAILWLIAAAAIAIIAGGFASWWFRRRGRSSTETWALREIASIRRRAEFQDSSADGLFAQLSVVMREYVSDRFSIDARSRSSEELMSELQSRGMLESQHREKLHEFLRQSDQARFAGVGMGDDVVRSCDLLESFIDAAVGDRRQDNEATRRHDSGDD